MDNAERLRRLGLFDARVPRYTSYPTAPNFSAIAPEFHADCLAAVTPEAPVSVYIHIPFCERLCWFCACHTQGTKTLSPVERYVAALERELAQAAARMPAGVRMGRMHWGGGTPTILPPALIHRLAGAAKAALPPVAGFEFSVEIDPTLVDDKKIAALAAEGMTRASIGIQDFDPQVQAAIGRRQSFAATAHCVARLRAAGVTSLNADLVYGLPHQDAARMADTVEKVLRLNPDRVALFGYAHVPWVSKRQRLIDGAALPGDEARWHMAERAGAMLGKAGMLRLGIDHFARPGDRLAEAAAQGRLRRNFQGYTEDGCRTLLGFGASAISLFPQGYVQNAPATAAWHRRVEDGVPSGARGHRFSGDDRLRARAIEMLMCDFRVDWAALRAAFGPAVEPLRRDAARVLERFPEVTAEADGCLVVRPEGRPLLRLIARCFDAYAEAGGRFSRAS
jgi:oxygen-independent coproporphyrinogen-3 oxidase